MLGQVARAIPVLVVPAAVPELEARAGDKGRSRDTHHSSSRGRTVGMVRATPPRSHEVYTIAHDFDERVRNTARVQSQVGNFCSEAEARAGIAAHSNSNHQSTDWGPSVPQSASRVLRRRRGRE
jgi:hypothetical protein